MAHPCRSAGLLIVMTLAGHPACRQATLEDPPTGRTASPPATAQVPESEASSTGEPAADSTEPIAQPVELTPEPAAEPMPEPAVEPMPEPATEPYDVGGDVTRPERLSGGYLDLRASDCPSLQPGGSMRQLPVVIIGTVIDRQGRVGEVEFLKHEPDPCVADYLKTAVSEWRFKPATLRGQPVAVKYYLTTRTHFR